MNSEDPYNFTIYRGIDFLLTCTWTDDATGAAVPITGWAGQWDFRHAPSKSLIFSIPITIDDGAAGIFSGALSAAQTDAIAARQYTHDLVFTDADSKRRGPVWSGVATVEELNSQP